jgi:Na+/H+ antiporter NhaB
VAGTAESLLFSAAFCVVAVPLSAIATSLTVVAVAKPFLRARHKFIRTQATKVGSVTLQLP